MKYSSLNLIALVLLVFPLHSYSVDRETLDKVIEYLKIIGYEEVVSSSYDSCIDYWMETPPDYKVMIEKMVSVVESQRELKPGSLSIDANKLKMLLKELNTQYTAYAKNHCRMSHEKDEMYIVAREYAKYVTKKDMDVILAFARSPAGQKDILASNKGVEDAFIIISESRRNRRKKAADDARDRTMKSIAKYLYIESKGSK